MNLHRCDFSIFIFTVLTVLINPAIYANEHEHTNAGAFYHTYWFEHGIEYGNPSFNNRFRVNSPDVVLHESFGKRSEVRGNGMMQIFIEEDLSLLDGAELYLEIWGGHPHTENKRVTINGRSTYTLPEVGTAAGHCTHMYPTIPLKVTDLVNGYNVLQFACDEGDSFWGHFIVENACLRVQLKSDHPVLKEAGLDGFETKIRTEFRSGLVRLFIDPIDEISRVDYQAHYVGYDENGDGVMNDWHGFTKKREPFGYAGSSSKAPFSYRWDSSMIAQQHNVPVRAWVRFKDHPTLIYKTDLSSIPTIGHEKVRIFSSNDIPVPFWSRAKRLKTCTIHVDEKLENIEKAFLYCVTWDGGKGEVEDYFKLNGHALPAAGEGKHDVLYKQIEIDPSMLKQGDNQIELLSDTHHHGIEVLLPGPALIIKTK